MLGDFFKNKYNEHEHFNISRYELDIEFEDPEDIIKDYFDLICNVQSETQLQNYLTELFSVAYSMGVKDILYDEIIDKCERLRVLNYLGGE